MPKKRFTKQVEHIAHKGRIRRQSRSGVTAVEFAIAMSILLMIVFASIEFVRLSILRHSVEHASYVAARTGMIAGASTSTVRNAAQQHLAILGISNATVTVTPGTINDATDVIEVNVQVPTSGNSWISPIYFSGNLTGRTRMLAERAAAQMSAAVPTPPAP